MLIDDDEIDNFINQKLLDGCGLLNIQTFTSTAAALQHLTQTKDAPQIIFLDIYFPIMDGFEFLDKFAKLPISRQPIDIYILTTSVNPADKETAQHKKCAGFIEKPLTTEKIFAILGKQTVH